MEAQVAAACFMYVAVGSGALAAFCIRALQHAVRLAAGLPTPVNGFVVPASSTGSMMGSIAMGGAASVGGADAAGSGGGATSLLHDEAKAVMTRGITRPRVVRAICRFMMNPCLVRAASPSCPKQYPVSGKNASLRVFGRLACVATGTSRDGRPSVHPKLAASHGIAAVEALVAGPIADRDVATVVAHRCVPHHFVQLGVEGSLGGGR